MTTIEREVVAGVDTHADTHHAAVIATTGARIADAEFPATIDGYRLLLAFLISFGRLITVGVEGTNSYGAGLARFLRTKQVHVLEVIRPSKVARRRGKSDPIDAYAAAAAVLADPDLPIPKTSDGDAESIRALLAARRSAMRARSMAQNQIKSLLVTAPEKIRARFQHLTDTALLTQLGALRPGPATTNVDNAVLVTLRLLARRWRVLDDEITELDTSLTILTRRASPALTHATGVGPVVAAQLIVTAGDNPDRLTSEGAFAMLCGVAPIPASSGKTTRHRLNRGGDRQANSAIHRIAIVRLSSDPRSRDYLARRISEGKTKKDALRALKRAIAREIFRHLTRPEPVPDYSDLRPLRQNLGLTLVAVARTLDTNAIHISRLERDLATDDQLANRYREILLSAA